MYKLALLFSVVIVLNVTAKNGENSTELSFDALLSEQQLLENKLFGFTMNHSATIAEISDIDVIELDEEVSLGFDTANYLPKGFNALKGKHDLDWSAIELVELDEEVEFGFDTAEYLPEGFNPLKGKHDLDWSTIELFEIEEEVILCFDTNEYLEEGFNALKGKHDLDWTSIELIEIEEEVEINFDIKAYLPSEFDPGAGTQSHEAAVCLY
jgi:hypothetical protein